MKKIFTGLLCSFITGANLVATVKLFRGLGDCAGVKAVLVFLVAILALIVALTEAYAIGDQLEVAAKVEKAIEEEGENNEQGN